MNIEEINQVFADVDAKIAGKGKASDFHRDYELERMVDELDTDSDVTKYVFAEFESWFSLSKSLGRNGKTAVLCAIIAYILTGANERAKDLTPLQKVYYHAGVRLLEMKILKRKTNQSNGE